MMKWILPLLLITVACVDTGTTPEAALEDFVESRIGHVVTRQFVIDRVTGQMKQSFENMSDPDFEKFADLRNVKQDSFKVVTKSCQEKKCFLTYSIAYQTKPEDVTTFNSEVKKIAELVLVEGKWLIAEVSNIKTYHEATQSINPLE